MVATLWGLVIVLAITGVSSAVLRTLVVTGVVSAEKITQWALDQAGDRAKRISPADVKFIEERYEQHPWLMLVHALPGPLFMILGPLQFFPLLRSRHIRLHRWSGRVYLVSGVMIGVSALVMPFRFPLVSGTMEVVAILFFGSLFLFALGKAFFHIRRGQIADHREWMIRAFALGLAIAADRPATSFFLFFTQMPLREFFGIGLWLCFCSHALAGEAWINYTRPAITKTPLTASAQSA